MKTKNTHTPGPWAISSIGHISDILGGETIGLLFYDGGEQLNVAIDNDPHAMANALLIAAAPDMLEANRQAESLLSSGFIIVENAAQARQIDYTLKTIRAAIAKAEGR